MERSKLINDLKEIQRHRMLDLINNMSEEDLFDTFYTCGSCGEELISKEEFEKTIIHASDIDEFLDTISSYQDEHNGDGPDPMLN